MEAKIWNEFLRLTLVSKSQIERLTLDINLQFYNSFRSVALGGLAVAEVKQERFSFQSTFIQEMRAIGLRPSRFSKYCAGINYLYRDIKQNRFKKRLLEVEKLLLHSRHH